MRKDKRFKIVHEKRKGQLFITDDFYDNGDDYFPHNLDYGECVRLLNDLYNENEQLKQELHKIYKPATVNKVREIVEKVYDDLLYKTTNESDYARKKIKKCLEDIDEFYEKVRE